MKDKQTDDGDDGERNKNFDHIYDDVLVYGYFDDGMIPAQKTESEKFLLFYLLICLF